MDPEYIVEPRHFFDAEFGAHHVVVGDERQRDELGEPALAEDGPAVDEDRVGVRPVVLTAPALIVLGMAAIAAAPTLGLHIAATVVLGLGLSGVLGSSLRYIFLAEAGRDERAVAQGLSTIFLSVGQLTGAALLAALAASATDSEAGYRLGVGGVAVGAAALVVAALFLPRTSTGRVQR